MNLMKSIVAIIHPPAMINSLLRAYIRFVIARSKDLDIRNEMTDLPHVSGNNSETSGGAPTVKKIT
jgi:hypothetical protein